MISRWAVVATALFGIGCTEECVDQFDCLKVASKSPLTCDDGRCVVKTTLPTFPMLPSTDAGRPDGGTPVTPSDGGVDRPISPGAFTARLTGGQIVPSVRTMASGTLTGALTVTDGGPFFSWSLSVTNTAVAALEMGFGGLAGRPVTSSIPLSRDGGTVALTRAQAEQLSSLRASVTVVSVAPELRGQIVPRGAFVGFTQLVLASDGGYGGGGQLVFETDGGFIPTTASFELDWTEAGPVRFAALIQGTSPLLVFPLNATGTGSSGTFSPLSLLSSVTDAGIFAMGFGADGGTIFRGDLSLSLR